MNSNESEKRSFLFKRLVLMFHTAAMQQMGKLSDPVSGQIDRNLEQAALSIDTLDMIREKCQGNLTTDETSFLEHLISELKLNYVDEVNRPDQEPESEGEKPEDQQAEPVAEN